MIVVDALIWGGAMRCLSFLLALLLALLFIHCGGGGSTQTTSVPVDSGLRYLQVSASVPNSRVVMANKSQIEQAPYNGIILALLSGRLVFQPSTLFTANATWLDEDRTNMPQINSSALTDNFLLMRGSADASFDPFNDTHWATAEANIRTVATMAKLGSLKGVAFDPEGYSPGKNIFTYSNYTGHTFAACQAQLRLRGKQFMTTIQEAYPNSQVFLFGALSMQTDLLDSAKTHTDPDAFMASELESSTHTFYRTYGLLPSFLNGMLEVITPGMTLIDGSEVTYPYYRSTFYSTERDLVLTYARDHLVESTNRTRYTNQMKLGMSVYMDASFDQTNSSANLSHYMDASTRPRFFDYQLYWGLKKSDAYLWIYSETTNWYTRTDIPSGAETAMSSAKARVEAGASQGDSAIEGDITTALAQVP